MFGRCRRFRKFCRLSGRIIRHCTSYNVDLYRFVKRHYIFTNVESDIAFFYYIIQLYLSSSFRRYQITENIFIFLNILTKYIHAIIHRNNNQI